MADISSLLGRNNLTPQELAMLFEAAGNTQAARRALTDPTFANQFLQQSQDMWGRNTGGSTGLDVLSWAANRGAAEGGTSQGRGLLDRILGDRIGQETQGRISTVGGSDNPTASDLDQAARQVYQARDLATDQWLTLGDVNSVITPDEYGNGLATPTGFGTGLRGRVGGTVRGTNELSGPTETSNQQISPQAEFDIDENGKIIYRGVDPRADQSRISAQENWAGLLAVLGGAAAGVGLGGASLGGGLAEAGTTAGLGAGGVGGTTAAGAAGSFAGGATGAGLASGAGAGIGGSAFGNGAFLGEGAASGIPGWDAALSNAVPGFGAGAGVGSSLNTGGQNGAFLGEGATSGVGPWDSALANATPGYGAAGTAGINTSGQNGAFLGEGAQSGVPGWDSALSGAAPAGSTGLTSSQLLNGARTAAGLVGAAGGAGGGGGGAGGTTSAQLDPRIAEVLYGQGGLIPSTNALFRQQFAQGGLNDRQRTALNNQWSFFNNPQHMAGWQNIANAGQGLLSRQVASNPYNR